MTKKLLLIFLGFILIIPSLPLSAQEDEVNIRDEAEASDSEDKLEGLKFTPIPLPSYSSDDGFGYGLRVYGTYYEDSYEPYSYQMYAQFYQTTKGYEYHIISLDTLRFLGTPFRVKAKAGFERYLNAQYYGSGNYHDIQNQHAVVKGEVPVSSNIPVNKDLIQLTDEITLNENIITDPKSMDSYNPGRRILRERQNKYYNYDRIRPFLETSSEDFFGKSNFKWFLGFRLQSYKIQTYWNDYEKGEAEKNSRTLIDIEQPVGYEAIEDPKMINTVRFALAYDSRPRIREKNPNDGTYADIHVETTGKGTGSEYSYTRVTTGFRQYYNLLPGYFKKKDQEVVFAFRLLGQMTYGDVPFFEAGYITPMSDSEWNEGLGSNRGLRGYPSAQFVDNAMGMLNTEIRYTFMKTNALGGIDFMLLGYYDTGRVAPEIKELSMHGLHNAVGGGLRLIWQKNTIVNISYGKSQYEENLNFSFDHPF